MQAYNGLIIMEKVIFFFSYHTQGEKKKKFGQNNISLNSGWGKGGNTNGWSWAQIKLKLVEVNT